MFSSPAGYMLWSFGFSLLLWSVHSIDSSKLPGNFPEALIFNWLFLKPHRFICNWAVGSLRSSSSLLLLKFSFFCTYFTYPKFLGWTIRVHSSTSTSFRKLCPIVQHIVYNVRQWCVYSFGKNHKNQNDIRYWTLGGTGSWTCCCDHPPFGEVHPMPII